MDENHIAYGTTIGFVTELRHFATMSIVGVAFEAGRYSSEYACVCCTIVSDDPKKQ